MSRDEHGRFKPGYCGNPRGRPRKQPREISPRKMRNDFFALGQMPVTKVEGGKRKTIPADFAITTQLIKKAVEGERWAIELHEKLRYKYTQEFFEEQINLLETLVETEKICRKRPEEVTEKLLEIIRETRTLLAPGFRT